MDFKQMRYFVALYEERNMTRAARRVHVVQAAVSQQIRRLTQPIFCFLGDQKRFLRALASPGLACAHLVAGR